MAILRHEINILDHEIVGSLTSNERILIDSSQYNGTVTAYLEVVGTNTSATNNSIAKIRISGGGADKKTLSVPPNTSTNTLVRSTSFSLTAGQEEYEFVLVPGGGGTSTIKSARIIIIQDTSTITNVETQIEIGNYNIGLTAETATILTNPKYWKYDASKWDGTTAFYAEAVYDSGTMDTVSIFLYESADILAPSWSLNATIVSAATTTVPTRTRVSFTPVDGRWYTIFSLNGSMDNHDIYRAGIVVQQASVNQQQTVKNSFLANIYGGTASSGELNQEAGQSFTTSGAYSLTGIILAGFKNGSPTDNLQVTVYSDSITGTLLGTSNSVPMTQVPGGAIFDTRFDFSTPINLLASTKYYFQLKRDGARDTSNMFQLYGGVNELSGDGSYIKSNNSWGSENTDDVYFRMLDNTSLTKLEPQYLLANTLLGSGFNLQLFLTKWDSSEWSGITNTYYFQAEGANDSVADLQLEEADGGGTLATLTNIDNAQISSAITMPTSQNLDIKAGPQNSSIAAARILVAVLVVTVVAIPNKIYNYNQAVKRAAYW